MAKADVNYSHGKAVIYEPDERIYLLDVENETPMSGAGTNFSKYLRRDDARVIHVEDIGEYPYDDFLQVLIREEKMYHAATTFGICIDDLIPVETRTKLLDSLEQLLDDAGVREFVLRQYLGRVPDAHRTYEGLPQTGHIADVVAAIQSSLKSKDVKNPPH